MKYTILIAIFAALIFTTCTKYPDGGNNASSLDGPYGLEQMTVNGVDSATLIFANRPCSNFNWFIFHETTLTNGCDTMPLTTWVRSTDKKQLIITCTPTPGGKSVYPLIQNRNCTIVWDIQRLTGEDLWIKTTYNGKGYYLKFAYQH